MPIDKDRVQSEAWVGDAVLLLWARLHILQAGGAALMGRSVFG